MVDENPFNLICTMQPTANLYLLLLLPDQLLSFQFGLHLFSMKHLLLLLLFRVLSLLVLFLLVFEH